MINRDIKLYLKDILEAIEAIEKEDVLINTDLIFSCIQNFIKEYEKRHALKPTLSINN